MLNKPEVVSFAQRKANWSPTPTEAKYHWNKSSLCVQTTVAMHLWYFAVLLQYKSEQLGLQNCVNVIASLTTTVLLLYIDAIITHSVDE